MTQVLKMLRCMGGLASRQKAITWTKFYQFQQAMYMKLWMMWPKICILIANILEMPLSCIKPVFKCSDNSGVCLRWTKLCCIVNEKPMAHQTLLMILQDVWWFVQNHQTYFLIIWKPFCQYSKLKCLSIFSKCLMICSLDILQIFHKGIMTIVMFYCLNSKNTHIYIYIWCVFELSELQPLVISLKTIQIPTFGNCCLSTIGGGKQQSCLAGWVYLSAEAAPGPKEYPQHHSVCTEDSGVPMRT